MVRGKPCPLPTSSHALGAAGGLVVGDAVPCFLLRRAKQLAKARGECKPWCRSQSLPAPRVLPAPLPAPPGAGAGPSGHGTAPCWQQPRPLLPSGPRAHHARSPPQSCRDPTPASRCHLTPPGVEGLRWTPGPAMPYLPRSTPGPGCPGLHSPGWVRVLVLPSAPATKPLHRKKHLF